MASAIDLTAFSSNRLLLRSKWKRLVLNFNVFAISMTPSFYKAFQAKSRVSIFMPESKIELIILDPDLFRSHPFKYRSLILECLPRAYIYSRHLRAKFSLSFTFFLTGIYGCLEYSAS